MIKIIKILLVSLLLMTIVGCVEYPDDVIELKELTDGMTQRQKVEAQCVYELTEMSHLWGEREDDFCVIDHIKKFPSVFNIDGFKGGWITYMNKYSLSIGRCNHDGDRCVYLASDMKHYMI